MRFHYITPLLVAIPLLFSTGNAWGCLMAGSWPNEEDLQYPPAGMVAFKGVITKISSHGDLDQGLPHSGFQLDLKITKVYQGHKLGDTITINYGGCHMLRRNQGDEVNVLARLHKKEGWSAPQFWKRSGNSPQKNTQKKKEWYQWW
jgi:hypothetical protein